MNTVSRPPMNILLAVDGSEHAFDATHLLRDLPCFPECHLTAMMVIIPKLTSFNFYVDSVLQKTKEMLVIENGPTVETRKIFSANPAEMINKFARENKTNLIVMGAKGLRATFGVLLGGTAQQVVEYSTCPVLIVRQPYEGLRKVLLVSDGSPHSKMTTKFLTQFHLPAGAQVEICHVMPPSVTPDDLSHVWSRYFDPGAIEYPSNVLEEINQQLEMDQVIGEKILQDAKQVLETAQVPVSQTKLLRGDAATEILNYCESTEIDLIVAGSRGLSQVAGWWLGSVSRKLVHYAPCSVMIVKGEPQIEDH